MNNREYILSFILESSAGEGKIKRLIAGAKKALQAKDNPKADAMITKVMDKRNRKSDRKQRWAKHFLSNKPTKTVFDR